MEITKEQVQKAIHAHGIAKAAKHLQIGYERFLTLRRKFGLPILRGTNQYNPKGARWSKLKPFDVIANTYYRAYASSAKRRGHTFEISLEHYKEFARCDCNYCGQMDLRITTIGEAGRRYRAKLNGVDRKDNRKGYTLENCVSCCRNCNYAKREMSEAEFLSWIESVHKFTSNKFQEN